MRRFTVEVCREDDVWTAEVIDLPGAATWARNLSALWGYVDEVIRLITELPEDEQYELERRFVNLDELTVQAAAVGEQRRRLQAEERQVLAAGALLAEQLTKAGWSVRDVAGLLAISPARASKLASADGEERRGESTEDDLQTLVRGWVEALHHSEGDATSFD